MQKSEEDADWPALSLSDSHFWEASLTDPGIRLAVSMPQWHSYLSLHSSGVTRAPVTACFPYGWWGFELSPSRLYSKCSEQSPQLWLCPFKYPNILSHQILPNCTNKLFLRQISCSQSWPWLPIQKRWPKAPKSPLRFWCHRHMLPHRVHSSLGMEFGAWCMLGKQELYPLSYTPILQDVTLFKQPFIPFSIHFITRKERRKQWREGRKEEEKLMAERDLYKEKSSQGLIFLKIYLTI